MKDFTTLSKKCSRCHIDQPRTEEYFCKMKQSKDGLRPECKSCRKIDKRNQYLKNKNKVLENQKVYRMKNKDAIALRDKRYRQSNRDKLIKKSQEHYLANKERYSKLQRLWREKNKGKKLEMDREYHWANREKILPRKRKYREGNIEHARAKNAAWRAANPDKKKQMDREYRQNNPHKINQHGKNRRARKLGAEGRFTVEDVQRIYSLQKGLCHWCGCKLGSERHTYHADHRIPLTKGGTNDPSNIVISCPRCNQSKNNKMPWEFAGRLF
jgi:hypothetical protein